MSILVLNAGSSTLKFGLFERRTLESRASGTMPDGDLESILALLSRRGLPVAEIELVGHRVVHGGEAFKAPTLIDDAVLSEIDRLSPLSPLHNPPALRMIGEARRRFNHIPHVAVFDTAFFAPLPAHRILYPLPYKWYSDWGIRRFGFHGISHAYCAARATELLPARRNGLGLVICHLGSGCSATAVQNGRPVSTTMGFTPLEGLMMATRSGSVDPGLLLYIMKEKGLAPAQVEDALHHHSGLRGVSGVSGDFREVEKAALAGNARARLALEMYADRVRCAIGALVACLKKVDAIVFTAGVGEHSAMLRRAVCEPLQSLGALIDTTRNKSAAPDADVAAKRSTVRILTIHTREEWWIARDAKAAWDKRFKRKPKRSST